MTNTLAKRLVRARQVRDMSQADLGRAIGLSQSAIYQIENRKKGGSSHVFQLAEALDVNVAWLATGKGPMRPSIAVKHASAMLALLKEAEPKLGGDLQERIKALVKKIED